MTVSGKERLGLWLIAVSIVTGVAAVWSQSPIAQDASYHLFNDSRIIGSVPNFWNVVSNVPFLVVGLLGLYRLLILQSVTVLQSMRLICAVFFLGVALVSAGSAYYHLWPGNQTLLWDRLPMTIAFMALFSIVIGEFVLARIGKLLFLPLLAAGMFTVLYWDTTEAAGAGDLRFYALVQFLPMLIIPIVLVCFRSTFTKVSGYWWLLGAYFAAKMFEHFDGQVFGALQIVSGHSIKHVIAALGVYCVLQSYGERKFLTEEV